MAHELMQAFKLDGFGLGSLAACYFYAYLCMQLPVGILLDRYNPRILISAAILTCSLGAFIFSHSDTLLYAQIGRVLIGVGGAFSAVGTMKIISMWFPPRRFALMSGLMMAMAMLGAIGGEAPLSILVKQTSWRASIQYCALAGICLACLVFFFVRNKEKTNKHADQMTLQSLRHGLIQILKNKQTWLLSFYSGLAFVPISAFAGLWGVPFICQKYSLTKDMAATLVSLSFIGFAIGSPFAGWLSDKIKRRKLIMISGTITSLISISTMLYCTNLKPIELGILFFIFGYASGFFFVSFATIRENYDTSMSGTSIAFINMFNALFGAIFEPLIGYALDLEWPHIVHNGTRVFSTHAYQFALSILPAGLVIALLCQFGIKETHCRNHTLADQ